MSFPRLPRALAAIPALALVAALAGCAASAPAPVLLSLPHAGDAMAPVSAAAAVPAPTLVVRRVGVPEYLASRRVRYRADASTLAEWPNTFWAERIEIGVTREFVAALRQRLPGWTVCDATCDDGTPALSLQVDLAPLDYLRSAQQLEARARVVVSSVQAEPKLLQQREQGFRLKAGSDTAQAEAEAISELLSQVAALAAPAVLSAKP